jgi:hypothetical protein
LKISVLKKKPAAGTFSTGDQYYDLIFFWKNGHLCVGTPNCAFYACNNWYRNIDFRDKSILSCPPPDWPGCLASSCSGLPTAPWASASTAS